MKIKSINKIIAKPFIKWAGGKTQLLPTFADYYPNELTNGEIERYIEPFVGGGAVLFEMLNKYDIEEVYISDINRDLINTYLTIKYYVEELIEYLTQNEKKYLELDNEGRKELYYQVRDDFNSSISQLENNKQNIKRAGQFIFLNRTCFNGLFRVNRSGLFNVPMGDYKNPTICDSENLYAVSMALKNVKIYCGDYRECIQYVDNNTLVYFDPPYRPLNATSSFTSYSKFDFDDKAQIQLAEFFNQLSDLGAKLILSNSNPKNTDPNDLFFDNIYSEFNIYTINAKRMINSKGTQRGSVSEIIVTNYSKKDESMEDEDEIHQAL